MWGQIPRRDLDDGWPGMQRTGNMGANPVGLRSKDAHHGGQESQRQVMSEPKNWWLAWWLGDDARRLVVLDRGCHLSLEWLNTHILLPSGTPPSLTSLLSIIMDMIWLYSLFSAFPSLECKVPSRDQSLSTLAISLSSLCVRL